MTWVWGNTLSPRPGGPWGSQPWWSQQLICKQAWETSAAHPHQAGLHRGACGQPLPAGLRRCETGHANPPDSSGECAARATRDHLLSQSSNGCSPGEDRQEKPEPGAGWGGAESQLSMRPSHCLMPGGRTQAWRGCRREGGSCHGCGLDHLACGAHPHLFWGTWGCSVNPWLELQEGEILQSHFLLVEGLRGC